LKVAYPHELLRPCIDGSQQLDQRFQASIVRHFVTHPELLDMREVVPSLSSPKLSYQCLPACLVSKFFKAVVASGHDPRTISCKTIWLSVAIYGNIATILWYYLKVFEEMRRWLKAHLYLRGSKSLSGDKHARLTC